MPKLKIASDEFYPIYFEDDWDGGTVEIELTDPEAAWVRNASKRFWNAQAFLEQKVKEASEG